jgi:DNA-damage-inducible protein D
MGLYGSLTIEKIDDRKRLAIGEKILDYLDSQELATNLLCVSQTESKLRGEDIQGATAANQLRYVVDREVCAAIERLGGIRPEDLPAPLEKHMASR